MEKKKKVQRESAVPPIEINIVPYPNTWMDLFCIKW